MANKELNIGIKVDSSQLDQTVQKVGELKQLSSKIAIQYDIDGKPIDLVINKSLNLQQQVKALTAELRRTKEGTAEFALLSSRLNDAKDNLERVNVKSKDLFASLSLLPGPIGQFFGQLNGAIGLLKTFSGFSLKDIGNQFRELGNDIKDIYNNFLGLSDTTNGLSDATNQAANSQGNFRDAISDSIELSKTQSLINRQQLNEYETNQKAIKNLNNAISKGATDNNVYTLAVENANTKGREAAAIINKQTLETRTLTAQELQLAAANKNVTISTDGYVVAAKQATFWTSTLGTTIKTVLISTGILAAIVVIGELVGWIYRWVTSSEEAEAATRSLTSAIEEQQRVLQNDLDAVEMATKANITRAKIAGKTEEEIFKISKKGGEEKLALLRKFDEQLLADRDALKKNTVIKEEERAKLNKEINDKLLKNGQDITKQILSNEQSRLEEQLRITEKGRAAKKKEIDENKEHLKKIADDTKTANQQLKDIRNQNMLDAMQDERFKQRSEIEFQRAAEEDKINELLISDELKGKLREQIAIKYDLKSKALKKKFDEDDQKAAEEFTKKLAQISIEAIEKDIDRQVAAREEKYSNDLRELEKDKEFIKMSEDTKGFYRAELLKAKEEDIRKIKIDATIKTYQDELTLLSAQQKNLLEGTDAYYQNQLKVEENAYQTKLLNAKKNNDDISKIEKEHEENLKNIRLQGFIAEKNLAIQRAGVIKGIGDSLQQLAGKNKDVAIAGILVTKAAGVAEIIMNTQIANAKALATLGPIAGPIWVAVNSVAAGLSIAATVKSAVDGINQIKQQGQGTEGGGAAAAAVPNYGRNYEKGGMIGGRRHAQGGTIIEAEQGEAIMTRGAVTMFRPLLSLMNQAGGGVSFNSNLTTTGFDNPKVSTPAEDNKPMIVKTYVVSSELTNEQQRQARLKDLSTL